MRRQATKRAGGFKARPAAKPKDPRYAPAKLIALVGAEYVKCLNCALTHAVEDCLVTGDPDNNARSVAWCETCKGRCIPIETSA